MKTTLKKIKKHSACEDRYKVLLKYLGKTKADDEPLPMSVILKSNGLDDAIWALRTLRGCDKEIRLFAADCAGHVLKYYEKEHPNDKRPREAIKAARKFAKGEITSAELNAAYSTAYSTAYSAAYSAADYAAYSAAYSAAYFAAYSAAYYAAEKAYQKRIFKKYFCKKGKK
jgi:uncharacterized iron-regulated membrane protein